MTNNAFCSICTVNYTTYAATLNDSLIKAGHKEPYYVLIVDYNKKYEDIISKFNFTPIHLNQFKRKNLKNQIETTNQNFQLATT